MVLQPTVSGKAPLKMCFLIGQHRIDHFSASQWYTGLTALHIAVMAGHLEVSHALITHENKGYLALGSSQPRGTF